MKDQRENLSALIDDYQGTENDQTLLDEISGDVNQQYTMRRYHMISEVMRNEMPDAIQLDFATGVMSQIEQEPQLQVQHAVNQETVQQPSWFWSVLFKPIAGLAIAATVAVVAVSSLQLQTPINGNPDQIASIDSSSEKIKRFESLHPIDTGGVATVSTGSQRGVSANGMNWKIKRNGPAIQKKLNTYLIIHNEFSHSMQGIIPQVRVVGFDAQK